MKKTGSTALLRSGWTALAAVLLAALLLGVNWRYYQLTRAGLSADFGDRLRLLASLASTSAGDVSGPLNDAASFRAAIPERTAGDLRRLASDFGLSGLTIVREDGVVLFSLREGLIPPGEIYPNWDMDYPAIIAALEGTPAASRIFRGADGSYLMAGYAPFPPGTGAAGAVAAVEADAAFLARLERLRRLLLAASAASVVGVALFLAFILRATNSLLQARESLSRSETLASMGRMAAGIAHEIRNPLFIIRSAAERLKKIRPADAGEIDEFVIEEVDRLNGILTDYLLFARDEPGRRHPMDIAATVRRSVRLVEESFAAGGVRIETPFDGGRAAPFEGEEKKLQQCFLNCMLNARQAMEEGGTLVVDLREEDGWYVVSFADTGPGIPERDRLRVFEPFYTTRQTGSGLGLSIVRRVIEDHGGAVRIGDRPGGGAVVTFSLPRTDPTGDTDEQDTDR
ncbi:MAG: hypothetical protein JW876_11220 [Candidatus Krumholzibacteriota bacterium]|nr:hypothetical protein [Candidatus Krumholzibacteriota bacterium]